MGVPAFGKFDPTSFSNADEVIIKHIEIFWRVNFDVHTISGRVELHCEKQKDTNLLILDSKDLTVKKIYENSSGRDLKHDLSSNFKTFGASLTINLPTEIKTNFVVVIEYETSSKASGLMWLTPEQTYAKKEPFLFSQCQAIHARSILPCQDTPGVKFTFKAEIVAPSNLTVLLSGLHDEQSLSEGQKVSKFHQPVPIPSYLVAIAVGRLASLSVGPRCKVWAEPEQVEASAHEFAETEKKLEAAIGICGNYEWGVYDVLVMPPSFPFGGMENPCITFVTPTTLAGDRSLSDVIAHELAHSWSGNLVTTRTFEHFWLNEGFTTFIERKIEAALHGTPNRHFSAIGGLKILKDTIATIGADNPNSKLVLELNGIDPDDAYTTVPYEKGHTFLFFLEELVGGPEVFDPFLKSYFSYFRNKSITTDQFKTYFLDYFKNTSGLDKIDWNDWLYGTGMPKVIPQYDETLVNACSNLAKLWLNPPVSVEKANEMMSQLTSNQKILFLAILLDGDLLPTESIRQMEDLYGFHNVKNAEIRFKWLRLGIKSRCPEFVPKALEFVNEQGRMKFVRPLYRDLYAWEEKRQMAIDNYLKNKEKMMFVTANQTAKDLHLVE